MKNKRKGLEDELKYCQYKYENNHPSPHWLIRIKEIELELLTLFLKEGKKNVKGKTRKRQAVRIVKK